MTSSQEQRKSTDPTVRSSLRPLRELLTGLDNEIAQVYAQRGVTGVRPRFSKALIRLYYRGSLTVKELAEEVEVTHSAMSQTLTAMRRDGLVESVAGADARTRSVALTDKGRALVPFLEAEWRATEAAWSELDAEVPYPLHRVVADLAAAVQKRPFAQRVSRQLDRELSAQDNRVGTGTAENQPPKRTRGRTPGTGRDGPGSGERGRSSF